MVNFGQLAAGICWRVCGAPANFNGFRVLAALLHGTPIVGVSQTAALNRRRDLYSARRPSRWALAHISSFVLFMAALWNRAGHYTVNYKKRDILFLTITLANLNRFYRAMQLC